MDIKGVGNFAANASAIAVECVRSFVALATPRAMMLLPFLLTPLGRLLGTLAIIAIAWFGFARHYETKGEQKLAAKIEKAQDAKVKKASTARRSVDRIPDERLRDEFFRN
jgi:hypothetical protein